jgi:hypothetical protein
LRLASLIPAVFGCLMVSSSFAATAGFSFQGTIGTDDEVQLFTFFLNSASTVVIRTWSYAGGVNAAGQTIQGGGFDPILAVFDDSGLLIDQQDDTTLGPASDNLDAYISANLNGGAYNLSLMQFDNFANGPNLSDGFRYSHEPTFTEIFGCSNNTFCSYDGLNRTGDWAVDITGADSAAISPSDVPEPQSYCLALLGVGILILDRERVRLKNK